MIFFYCTGVNFLAAQNNAVLLGIIIDTETSEPLTGVTVVADDTTGTSTDIKGFYTISLTPGEHNLQFSYLGYKTTYRSVKLNESQALTMDIRLQPTSASLGTIVISAGKFEQNISVVPVSMEVLKPTLIDNKNTTTIETAIEQVPGVSVIDGQANIRSGSGYSYGAGSRVLMLVDGIPALAPDANDIKWTFIPVESVGQIEVLKGASSALYGSSAMNGVINVQLAKPSDKPETKIDLFYGWYGNPKRSQLKWWGDEVQESNGLSFSHREKVKQFDLVLGGQAFQDEGYRQGENEKRYRFNVNGRYSFSKVKGLYAGLNTNFVFGSGGNFFLWENDSTGAYLPQGGLVDSTTTISLYETVRMGIDPYITYTTSNGTSHKLKTRLYQTDNRNNTDQASTGTMYYGEYQFQKKLIPSLTFSAGLVEMYSVVTSELYEDHYSNNTALYAQGDLETGPWNISLGARLESSSIDDEDKVVIPVIRSGISFQTAEYTHLRVSYGQGYRYPSIAEKYISTSVGSIVIYPNDSIDPESGWTAECGIRQGIRIRGWKGLLDIAGFWSEYQDMLEFTFGLYGPFAPPSYGLGFKSVNIGNTVIKGIDISLSGTGNIGKLPVSILAGYTYSDPRQKNFNAAEDTLKNSANYNILKYRYRHLFKGDVEFDPGNWMFGFSTRYNSFMENVDAVFESLIPGVNHYRTKHDYGDWVFDLRVGYRLDKSIMVSFICNNVFNHEYMSRPADMQPPRNYALRFSFNY